MKGLAKQHDEQTFCNIPFNMLNIISTGHLAACCVDFTDALSVADLHKTSLEDAWKSSRFRAIRNKRLLGDLREGFNANTAYEAFYKLPDLLKNTSSYILK